MPVSRTDERTDATAWLRLCLVPAVPGTAQRALLKAFGSPAAIVAADPQALAAVVGHSIAAALAGGPPPGLLEAILGWLAHPRHHLLTLADARYPRPLLQIPDPPTVLFAIGDLQLLERHAFAIVGSRNASRQGLIDAQAFARSLSDTGFTIVSGLALGIDTAAHRGGLAGSSSSVAVVGTGLDRVYPAANQELAHQIAERGVMISEFALGAAPIPANFPRRNRIISGLCRGVLVVEAAPKSGSLITARFALEQGREVFAIPGSIHSPQSKGCHWLIKQGAKLVECADDIIQELGLQAPTGQAEDTAEPTGGGDPLLEVLGHAPASLDSLSARSGRAVQDLAVDLTRLELAGRIEKLPGGLFRQLVMHR
jgi:DNA processing protein